MTGANQVGQPYYGMQRPVYSVAAPPSMQQQPNIGGYAEGIGMVKPPAGAGHRVCVGEQTYAHVSYDGAGRQ